MFHFAVAEGGGALPPGDVYANGGAAALAKQWRQMKQDTGAKIFVYGAEVLESGAADDVIGEVVDAARDAYQSDDGGGLPGRAYQSMLAKPLGAFYTSPASAALLAGLVLNAGDWQGVNWGYAGDVAKLQVADPACGSGALLVAACRQVAYNFARVCGDENENRKLRRALVENVVWGCDILPTAIRLSEAALGMFAPDADFSKARINRATFGGNGNNAKAGSLEMLDDALVDGDSGEAVSVPAADVCVMNPPFVRGGAGGRSYGFLPDDERESVRRRINDIAKRHGFSCDKGLGAAFVALACREGFVKEGGRLAVILPAAAATGMGSAWRKMRAMVEKDFDVEMIVASHDSRKPNFSENTALQECIIIARKREPSQQPSKRAFFVALRKNPAAVNESRALLNAVAAARDGEDEHGEIVSASDEKQKQHWGRFAYFNIGGRREGDPWRGISFADLRLAEAAEVFANTGALPFGAGDGKAPMRRLGDIAVIGGNTLHLKLNHDDFKSLEIADGKTPFAGYYPALHKTQNNAAANNGIMEHPHCHLKPLPGREEWAKAFFAKAGRVVLRESFRFNTARRLASLVSAPVQASHCWPISVPGADDAKLKALTLWLNSSPAILFIAHAAQATHGAKVGFSQNAARELPVPDLDMISRGALQKVGVVFNALSRGGGYLPLPQMADDPARAKTDTLVADILGYRDLAPLRRALAAEPVINGGKIKNAKNGDNDV